MSLGVLEREARQLGSSGKGWWRLSRNPPVHRALDTKWFNHQGLMSLEKQWETLLKAQ